MFIGRPNRPEQLAAMRLQMEQKNPTADALGGLSQSIQSVLQEYAQNDMKTKLQNQILQAKSDEAAAARADANARFEMGQEGDTFRAMLGAGYTLGPGSVPMVGRIDTSRFPLGPNEVQTQQIPGMIQLMDLMQERGIRPRAGGSRLAFNAPEPEPVKPSDIEIPPSPELDMVMKKAGMPHKEGTPVNRHVFDYAADVVLSALKAAQGGGAGGKEPTREEREAVFNAIGRGETSLSKVAGRGIQREKAAGEYELYRRKNPELKFLSLAEAESYQDARTARTKMLNSQQTNSALVAVDQFDKALDIAIRDVKKVNPIAFKPANEAKQFIARHVWTSGEYAAALAKLDAIIAELALQSSTVFSGSAATDIRVKQELKRIDSSRSLETFNGIIGVLREVANARRLGILGAPIYLPGGGTLQTGEPASAMQLPGTGPAGGPAPVSPAASNLDAIRSLFKKHLSPSEGQ